MDLYHSTESRQVLFDSEANQKLPYNSIIIVLKEIINRFGIEIYKEDKRLISLLKDLLPNSVSERKILFSTVSLGLANYIYKAVSNYDQSEKWLADFYNAAIEGGLDEKWIYPMMFVLGYPVNIDTRTLYPIEENRVKKDDKNIVFFEFNEYIDKSIEKLEELSDNGDSRACYMLGERYYCGNNCTKNYKKAMQYFKRAELDDIPQAKYNLGVMYEKGEGVLLDLEKAFKYFLEAAKSGYVDAEVSVGMMYFFGEGCIKDDREALYWTDKAKADMEEECSKIYIILARVLAETTDDSIKDTRKAVEYLKKAVDMEDPSAYLLMGIFYECGYGIKQDYKEAFKYYNLAADNGIEDAYLALGGLYSVGYGVDKDEAKAAEYYEVGADLGNMLCLNALGMCYQDGIGVKVDKEKAYNLFFKAAYAGNYAGAYNLGLCYLEGRGVEIDYLEAKKWFEIAAAENFSKAIFALGIIAERGFEGHSPDEEHALSLYLSAAEKGDYPYAQFIVGNCRSQGLLGSYIDEIEGFEWTLKAAQGGEPTAQNNIAMYYSQGIIVEQDINKSVEWFEKAVAQNDMYALDNYGTMLFNGKYVDRDIDRGIAMIENAANQGYSNAKLSLGVCYFEGWGKERNMDKALYWLTQAYNEGMEDAEKYLQRGFKLKGNTWVKKGLFSRLPEPDPLPVVEKYVEPTMGCNNMCINAVDKEEGDLTCYCNLLEKKVFCKNKCPYYEGVLDGFDFDLFD